MKLPFVKLSFLAALLYLTACSKSHTSPNGNEQLAEWILVTDSTFEGVAQNNHPVDYTGQPGDYFSFTTDGHVYTKEGEVLDTLTYTMVSSTGIIISDFGAIVNGVPDTSTITGLGSNSLIANTGNFLDQTIVIESPFFLTPGGEFWRKVTLSR
jgi:hypothetical protein